MKYFRVKGLDKFQHYKHRSPPWIKLHASVLDDYEFSCLGDAAKMHLMMIWLLASRRDNHLPWDTKWLAERLGASNKIDLDKLQEFDFIEVVQDADNMLADCGQSALSETEQSRDRAETDARKGAPVGLDFEAWDRFIDYRTKIRKPYKPVSLPAAMRKLAGYGTQQAAVVEQTIANGWTGLHDLKLNGGSKRGTHRKTFDEIEAEQTERLIREGYDPAEI